MITLQEIKLQRGKKLLFDSASANIFAKQKVGLVGVNGCGKSTLFSLLLKKISPDSGSVFVQSNLKISYLAQEVPDTEASALQYVIDGDLELCNLIRGLKEAEKQNNSHRITELHNSLYDLGGYNAESRAAKILIGLGFGLSEHQKSVNSFSGGWKMRLNLAQVLMSRADLLLLDEPTNYLDMDAIVWLESWLQGYDGTLLLISHDRDFLDNVTQKILHVDNKKLKDYSGNYSNFERQRAEYLEQEQAIYEKHQRKVEHLNKYIDRFRAKASKARQAQSRIKMLEKMDKVSITHIDSPFTFRFYESKKCSIPFVSMDRVTVGYGKRKILDNIKFSINPGESIGILGVNGAGKSTFMKTLAGVLSIGDGNIFFNKDLKVGYFAQHQIDQLDMDSSPLEHIFGLDPTVQESKIRVFLGGFGFRDDMVFGSIGNFSGGEKARLVLAMLIWQKPNLLLLDEPTNHLDLDMRSALTYALQKYDGALVLVAHDRYLLKATVDKFYLVNDGDIVKFDGDLDDYQKWLLDERKRQGIACGLEKNCIEKSKSKKKHLDFKKIKSIERELEKLQIEKHKIAEILSESDIYRDKNKSELELHLKKSAAIELKIKDLEDKWLEMNG